MSLILQKLKHTDQFIELMILRADINLQQQLKQEAVSFQQCEVQSSAEFNRLLLKTQKYQQLMACRMHPQYNRLNM